MTYQEVSYPHTEIYNWFYPEKKARKSFLYEIQLGKCQRCQKGFAKDVLTVDHIKPKSIGGNNSLLNLQLLCFKYHNQKTIIDRVKMLELDVMKISTVYTKVLKTRAWLDGSVKNVLKSFELLKG